MQPLSSSLRLSLALLIFSSLLTILLSRGHAELVAYYPLNGDAVDVVEGNDGTLVGDVAPIPDRAGFCDGALDFGSTVFCPPSAPGGPGGQVEIPDAPQLNPTAEITIAAWIKVEGWCRQRRVISKGTGGLNRQYGLLVNQEGLHFTVFGDSGTTQATASADPLPAGWHHFAGTYDGVEVLIFVDGTCFGATPYTESLQTGIDILAIGNKSTSLDPDEHFMGQVDEVRIYDEALSPPEIMTLSSAMPFSRGDCNNDGLFDIADPIYTLDYLFPAAGGGAPACLQACDGNDDGGVDIGDAIASLCALFGADTVPLAPPFLECGFDTTPDDLSCPSFDGCP